jgi:hypothetical protein
VLNSSFFHLPSLAERSSGWVDEVAALSRSLASRVHASCIGRDPCVAAIPTAGGGKGRRVARPDPHRPCGSLRRPPRPTVTRPSTMRSDSAHPLAGSTLPAAVAHALGFSNFGLRAKRKLKRMRRSTSCVKTIAALTATGGTVTQPVTLHPTLPQATVTEFVTQQVLACNQNVSTHRQNSRRHDPCPVEQFSVARPKSQGSPSRRKPPENGQSRIIFPRDFLPAGRGRTATGTRTAGPRNGYSFGQSRRYAQGGPLG